MQNYRRSTLSNVRDKKVSKKSANYLLNQETTFTVPGSSDKRLTGKGGKLNTSQAEPVAANSWAVGQFLSISL